MKAPFSLTEQLVAQPEQLTNGLTSSPPGLATR